MVFPRNKMKLKVIKGIGKGKGIGYPTLNFEIPFDFDLEHGVYFAKVFFEKQEYLGALFYGERSVFDVKKPSLEVYLIDFSGDISKLHINIEIGKKIRNVRKFDSIEDLKAAISDDVKTIKKMAKND